MCIRDSYPAAALFLLPMYFLFEHHKTAPTTEHANYQLLVPAALLGFLVNFAGILVIKCCSALTLKVLASSRNAAVVLFAAGFLHEAVTSMQVFGYSITLTGFAMYQSAMSATKKDRDHEDLLPLSKPQSLNENL
eukprot:TRINITY_DN650_c0_g1_i2.p1 TRINITY_DN650_c0_g1~~TRINITY_DN650_c0_g1_i2.p1  ORF type:complete len:135 (-),score=29.97 TRINITY_DN650_c0_g1_i2:47-451(-)